jgi:formate dehydrogenase maturation protein FdhE
MRDTEREILKALRVAQEEHPELAAVLAFYADLYEVLYKAKAVLPPPRLGDAAARRERLEAGRPQLTFDWLGVEAAAFGRLVGEVWQVLVDHNRSWATEGMQWTPEVQVAQAREVFERWGTLTAPSVVPSDAAEAAPDPRAGREMQAVAFALAAYLQRAADAVLPELDLERWLWAYCPVCGGQPNLALLDEERGARSLLCARCDGLWSYVRVGCPFCQFKGAQTYYLGGEGLYRLYVCPSCKRYLKTVDLRAARRLVLPVVERLLTVGMDLVAQQAGSGPHSD